MRRELLMLEWQVLCAQAIARLPPGATHAEQCAALNELGGPSPGGAASELDISRQRVHQLIDAGKLDAVYVREHKDAEPLIMITEASLKRLKLSRNHGVQQSLPFVKRSGRVRARPGKRD